MFIFYFIFILDSLEKTQREAIHAEETSDLQLELDEDIFQIRKEREGMCASRPILYFLISSIIVVEHSGLAVNESSLRAQGSRFYSWSRKL